MAGKKKSGNRIYGGFLFLYAVLITIAAVIGLRLVWKYAEEYEAARPNHAIDAYVDDLNQNLWNDGVAAAVAAMPHEAQSDEEIKAFVQEHLRSGVSAVRKGSSKNGENIVTYSLRCEGGEIGTVSIMEDSSYLNRVNFDMLPWKVSSDSFNFDSFYSRIEVVVPSNYSVWINGMQLGSEYIVEDGIHYDVFEDYYRYWDTLPTKVRYEYDRAIGVLEPEIRDEQGNVVTIDESRGDEQFIAPLRDDQLQRYYNFCDPFTRQYLIYTSGLTNRAAGNLYALQPYLLENSDLYLRMNDALDGLSWGHTASIEILDVRVNSVRLLVDGYAVCDVSADVKTFTYGKGEETRTTNFRVVTYDDGSQILAESLELY